MNARWSIELFGGLRVRQEDQIITRFRTQKTATLLAYLAYYPRMHAREILIAVLWPDYSPTLARNSLRVALTSLRRQLEPPGVAVGSVILADRTSVGLNFDAVATDVARFEEALHAAARAGSNAEQLNFLLDAVDLYQGDLLTGFYENWVFSEQQRLAEEFFRALSQVIGHLECSGDYERAIQYAEQGIRIDRSREAIHRDLMRLLSRIGQHESALRHFDKLKMLLATELDTSPSLATRALIETIRAEMQERQSIAPAPPPAEVRHKISLPTGTVTFLLTHVVDSRAPHEAWAAAPEEAMCAQAEKLRSLFQRHHGRLVQETEQSLLVAFKHASDAITCAIAGQRAMAAEPSALPVRMALLTGDVELREGEYKGLCLQRATQILLAAHGGQILCAESTMAVLRQDLEPGMRLLDLGAYCLRGLSAPERLYEVVHPDRATDKFPPPHATPAHGGNLPPALTSFFGRERELEQLRASLLSGETRLLTLTGIGGGGKTRLALEIARRIIQEFAEPFRSAVWFVPLAEITDPQLMANAVLDALHLRGPEGAPAPDVDPLEQVVAALSRQPSLLILDNFEHLVAHGANFVETLLARVPELTCLVTSRQCLDIPGEREFVVQPLPTPREPGTPEQLLQLASVQLFVNRARAVRPDFQVTERNAEAVVALCQCLEGIPLSIELAAARAQVLSPAQMVERLAERFE
ncbi:MAG: AAA family ATPase, partial [Armatimonadota bacterium]|nr:AAA family ATPase [Armatimonadota bacterium]